MLKSDEGFNWITRRAGWAFRPRDRNGFLSLLSGSFAESASIDFEWGFEWRVGDGFVSFDLKAGGTSADGDDAGQGENVSFVG